MVGVRFQGAFRSFWIEVALQRKLRRLDLERKDVCVAFGSEYNALDRLRRSLAGKLVSAFGCLCALVMLGIIASLYLIMGPTPEWFSLLGLALMALVLATLAFFVVVRRMMIEPLKEITDFATATNLKRLGARLNLRTGDELEVLSHAINRMMQRIDASMKRIQQLAFVDTVTELPNRERLRQETDEALKFSGNAALQGALIALDVDKFMHVQNTLGQVAGQELLAMVSERLAAAVRASDRIARLDTCANRPALLGRTNGSEFAVLLPDIKDPTSAGRFAQLISASLRQPFELKNHRIVLGASAGIAIFPQDGETGEDMLRSAELALSHARNAGGGRVVFFTRKLNQQAMQRLLLENEMRAGIEGGQFVAYYQPKIDLGTGRVCGCEALMRWEHPKHGLISPARFIPVAEETGMIATMGYKIMEDAAKAAAGWLRRGMATRVAVNVSAVQFKDPDFINRVLGLLEDTGLPPTLFELEVTESLAMQDPETVGRMLEPIRSRGVRIAMDDFGTGHSNLSQLSQLPFDVFKIDQSFVAALGKERNAPAMIETIIAMAGALNYETVAEGVETPEHAAFLKQRGATVGQGYLFGRPMPADAFEAFMRDWAATGKAATVGVIPKRVEVRAADIKTAQAGAPVILTKAQLNSGEASALAAGSAPAAPAPVGLRPRSAAG
jgi:diguanylate cyclase (GGDEF)-like protein